MRPGALAETAAEKKAEIQFLYPWGVYYPYRPFESNRSNLGLLFVNFFKKSAVTPCHKRFYHRPKPSEGRGQRFESSRVRHFQSFKVRGPWFK